MPRKTFFWFLIILLVIVIALGLGLVVGMLNKKDTSIPNQAETETITIADPFTIIPGNNIFAGMSLYTAHTSSANLLEQKAYENFPGVTEHTWAYKVKEKDVLFRSLAVFCEYKKTQGGYVSLGTGVDGLTTGENYKLIFLGLEKPLDNSTLTMWDRVKDVMPGCKEVWGSLDSDSQNIERLKRLFTEGDTAGFELDDRGVVDLRNIITLGEVGIIK